MSYVKRWPCRCNKCGARKTLAMHPNSYQREKYVTCGCGGRFRVDQYRKKKEHKQRKCHCNGYHFPHRAGGGVWCHKHPTGPSEQDYADRYGEEYV